MKKLPRTITRLSPLRARLSSLSTSHSAPSTGCGTKQVLVDAEQETEWFPSVSFTTALNLLFAGPVQKSHWHRRSHTCTYTHTWSPVCVYSDYSTWATDTLLGPSSFCFFFLHISISCFIVLCFTALHKYCIFDKLKVCGNSVPSKSTGAIFPNSICSFHVSLSH